MKLIKKFKLITVTSLVLFSFFVFGRAGLFAQGKAGGFEEIKTEIVEGVIVPEAKAKNYYSRSGVSGYFTPAKEDVLKAESKIVDYIEFSTPQSKSYPEVTDTENKLAEYKRQYVGVILNDKKRIWINFFCHAAGDAWKHKPVRILGGGACYFNVLYDIENGDFMHLRINGLAVQRAGILKRGVEAQSE